MAHAKTVVGYNYDKHQLIYEDTILEQAVERSDEQVASSLETLVLKSNTEFELVKKLGSGGMGAVFHAHAWSRGAPGPQDDVCKEVAVKLVTRPDPLLTESLIKEAQVIAQFDHDNIVYFILSDCLPDGTYFVVTQYVKGRDVDGFMELHNLIPNTEATTAQYFLDPRRENAIKRMPDKIAGFILWSVGNGLAYAHKHGVYHRDVSPGNIYIKDDEGSVKLGDFGIARTKKDLEGAEGKSISGKVHYISPEGVTTPDKVDGRSDIYSLGAVGYEMLTGLRPNETFPKEGEIMLTPFFQLQSTFRKKLVPPHEIVEGIDKNLSMIICKMLENNPEKRFQTADEFVDAIGRRSIFRKYGPTKAGLRDYISLHNNLEEMTETERSTALLNLSFLKKNCLHRIRDRIDYGIFQNQGKHGIFLPYVLTRYAHDRLANGENPARI